MVDALGRYQLSDIIDRVSRLLDRYALVINTATGAESTPPLIQDQSYSNTDITNQVNESLTALYSEMIVGKETLFASTIYQSTLANYPGPYSFPANMVQLRWMKWKDPGTPYEPNPGSSTYSPRPVDWYPMVQVDNPSDHIDMVSYYAPTWRWDAGQYYLNRLEAMANINGIQMNMVALPAELTLPTSVISVPQYVRVAQQALIYDVAFTLAFSRKKLVPEELSKKRDEWHTRLMTLVENAYNTQSVQLTAPKRMVRNTYTGRITNAGGYGRGWQ